MTWGRRITTNSMTSSVTYIKPMTRDIMKNLKKCYDDMSKTEQMTELTTKIYANAIEQAKTTDFSSYEFKPRSTRAPFNSYYVTNNRDEIIKNLSVMFPDSKITIGKISTDMPFAYFPTQESIKIDWS